MRFGLGLCPVSCPLLRLAACCAAFYGVMIPCYCWPGSRRRLLRGRSHWAEATRARLQQRSMRQRSIVYVYRYVACVPGSLAAV